jgi:hypothetical protein
MEPFRISEGLNVYSRINVSTKRIKLIQVTTLNIKCVELKLYVRSRDKCYTGPFIMFSVITNIYNKKTKGPTLMELLTATGKLKRFLRLEMFDVCTTGDTAHIDTIFKFLPHTSQHGFVDILHCCNDPCL